MATRRGFIGGALAGAAGLGSTSRGIALPMPQASRRGIPASRQSVCRWPYGRMSLDDFCTLVKRLGFGAVDLIDQPDWPTVAKHGLTVSTANTTKRGDFISRGLNNPANHEVIRSELAAVIPAAAQAGIPNVIAMFGNHAGASDAAAITNCAVGLEPIVPLAEQHGVTILLEMLNSKVDHLNFQGDNTAFGVAVCDRVDSPRLRLLYDIYHMQIMEGDVIRTIRDNAKWFAHYHTGGVPGRHELNEHQELQYAGIAQAIGATGFKGWLAHEFNPTVDAEQGLAQARDAVA